MLGIAKQILNKNKNTLNYHISNVSFLFSLHSFVICSLHVHGFPISHLEYKRMDTSLSENPLVFSLQGKQDF